MALEYKPKFLKATVTIELPTIEADAQVFGFYKPSEMANEFKRRLENDPINELAEIMNEDESDLTVVTAKVEVKDTIS